MHRESAYYVVVLLKTCQETIRLQTDTIAVQVNRIEEDDIVDEVTPLSDVLRMNSYSRQLDPKVGKRNAHVPTLIDKKLESRRKANCPTRTHGIPASV
jgi:hypothetical protein